MKKQHENVINALIFLLSPHLLNKDVLTLLSLPKHIANDINGHFKVRDIIKSKNICIHPGIANVSKYLLHVFESSFCNHIIKIPFLLLHFIRFDNFRLKCVCKSSGGICITMKRYLF